MVSRRKRGCLLFVLALVVLWGGCYVHGRLEQRFVLQTHFRLMRFLADGDTAQAYALTTNRYRKNHTLQEFETKVAFMKGKSVAEVKDPLVLSCCTFGNAWIHAWPNPGWFEFLNGPSFNYSKEDGEWRFTGEMDYSMD
ncbi:MAG TPA: hypothetical protein VJR02_12945 [Pyrinomonadaceae bacterium]|nr:hypothetical protein [Pyrinomonadaceae bacterium]